MSCLKGENDVGHDNQGNGRPHFSTGTIAGIVFASVVVFMLPIGIVYFIYRKRNNFTNSITGTSSGSNVGAPSVTGPNHPGNQMMPSGFPPVPIGEEGHQLLETTVWTVKVNVWRRATVILCISGHDCVTLLKHIAQQIYKAPFVTITLYRLCSFCILVCITQYIWLLTYVRNVYVYLGFLS